MREACEIVEAQIGHRVGDDGRHCTSHSGAIVSFCSIACHGDSLPYR
jgi:hypothetical protein